MFSRAFVSAVAASATIATLSPAPPASADPNSGKPDFAAAKRHYAAAEEAAAAKKWPVAVRQYQIAFEITRDPVLFFKLGDAHQQSGDCKEALRFYRNYLAQGQPNAAFKKDTEARMAACGAAAGSESAGAEVASESPSATDPLPAEDDGGLLDPGDFDAPNAAGNASLPEPGGSDAPIVAYGSRESEVLDEGGWESTAGWTSVGLAFAFATTGAVLALSANSRQEDLENLLAFRDVDGRPVRFEGETRRRYEELVDEGKTLETWSYVAFGAAGAAAVAAGIFFLMDEEPAEKTAILTPSVSESSVGVAAAWRF